MYNNEGHNQHEQEGRDNEECRCPYCHRRFQTVDDLTLHIVTRHTQTGIRRGPAQAGSGH